MFCWSFFCFCFFLNSHFCGFTLDHVYCRVSGPLTPHSKKDSGSIQQDVTTLSSKPSFRSISQKQAYMCSWSISGWKRHAMCFRPLCTASVSTNITGDSLEERGAHKSCTCILLCKHAIKINQLPATLHRAKAQQLPLQHQLKNHRAVSLLTSQQGQDSWFVTVLHRTRCWRRGFPPVLWVGGRHDVKPKAIL